MTNKIKKIVTIIMTMVILFSAFTLTGCNQKASNYSESEHIQRISTRVKTRFFDGDDALHYKDRPTDFSIYPLYNENDELKYFLIEFEPYGFLFVLLRDEQLKSFSWFGASTSMYMLSNVYGNETWSPYIVDTTNSQSYPDTDKFWYLDENGEKIYYSKSPFYIADMKDAKKYLLHLSDENFNTYYIPAIKIENDYLNLISMEKLNIGYGDDFVKKQATLYISFINKKHFDL